MLLPGQVENWNVFVDIAKLGVTEVPKKDLKLIIKAINWNYKSSTKSTFILNTTWLFDAIFKVVKGFLNELTKEKINVTKKRSHKMLSSMYHPSQLETQYGGTAPNNAGPFWPPNQPPSNEYSDDPNKLMSEFKYREIVKIYG